MPMKKKCSIQKERADSGEAALRAGERSSFWLLAETRDREVAERKAIPVKRPEDLGLSVAPLGEDPGLAKCLGDQSNR